LYSSRTVSRTSIARVSLENKLIKYNVEKLIEKGYISLSGVENIF
jgi:hypothetical protein